jgi:hypothetical protein
MVIRPGVVAYGLKAAFFKEKGAYNAPFERRFRAFDQQKQIDSIHRVRD